MASACAGILGSVLLKLASISGFRWATLLAVTGVLAGGSLYSAVEEGVSWFDGV